MNAAPLPIFCRGRGLSEGQAEGAHACCRAQLATAQQAAGERGRQAQERAAAAEQRMRQAEQAAAHWQARVTAAEQLGREARAQAAELLHEREAWLQQTQVFLLLC